MKTKLNACLRELKSRSAKLRVCALREEGEGFVDVLVKMLIVVVVGAALLGAMRAAVPDLFASMVTSIRNLLTS